MTACDKCKRPTEFPGDLAAIIHSSGGVVHCQDCGPPPVFDARVTSGVIGDIEAIGEDFGPCPDCGVMLSIGKGINPETGELDHSLFHPTPYCDYFHVADADDIARVICALDQTSGKRFNLQPSILAANSNKPPS